MKVSQQCYAEDSCTSSRLPEKGCNGTHFCGPLRMADNSCGYLTPRVVIHYFILRLHSCRTRVPSILWTLHVAQMC